MQGTVVVANGDSCSVDPEVQFAVLIAKVKPSVVMVDSELSSQRYFRTSGLTAVSPVPDG